MPTVLASPGFNSFRPSQLGISRPPAGVKINIRRKPPGCIPTDYVDNFPPWFNDLPLSGTFSWTLQLEGEPSGNFTFETWADNRSKVLCELQPGKKFVAFGVGFRIANINITELTHHERVRPSLIVSISLTHCHQWIDKEVPLRGGLDLDPDEKLDSCGNVEQISDDDMDRYRRVNWLCNRAGGNLSGFNDTKHNRIEVPIDTSQQEARIPRSEIMSRLTTQGKYIDFNEPNAIYCKKWTSFKNWKIEEVDIRSSISSSINGMGEWQNATISGKPFQQNKFEVGLPGSVVARHLPSLRSENTDCIIGVRWLDPKVQLNGLFLDDGEEEPEEQTQAKKLNEITTYRTKSRKTEVVIEDPDLAATPPDSDLSSDLSICFWKGGQNYVKVWRQITYLDGVKIAEVERKYGFAGPLAKDVYFESSPYFFVPQRIAVGGFWQIIEETNTIYNYENELEIYTGYVKQGWKLVVHKTEPDIDISDYESNPAEQFPTLKFTLLLNGKFPGVETVATAAETNCWQKELAAYTPRKVSVFEQMSRLNEPYSRYYKDAGKPDITEEIIQMPDGRCMRKAIVDKTWQQPYIVTADASYVGGLDVIDDPRNEIIKYSNSLVTDPRDKLPLFPALTTGTEALNRVIRRIMRSKNTLGVIAKSDATGIDQISDEVSDVDRFVTYSNGGEAGGAGGGFNSQYGEYSRQVSEGKPPMSDRLPPVWNKVDPEEQSGDYANAQNTSQQRKNYVWYAWTPDAPNRKVTRGNRQLVGSTIDLPFAKYRNDVRQHLETMINMENTKSAASDSFTIAPNWNIRPGDGVTYTANGERRKRRVLSVNNVINFQGISNGKLVNTSSGTQLTLGYIIEPSIIIRKDRLPAEADPTAANQSSPTNALWITYAQSIGNIAVNKPSRLYPPQFKGD